MWFPFTHEEAGAGFTERWWYGSPVYPDNESIFLRATDGNQEIARVHLGGEILLGPYVGVPFVGAQTLEIKFIEVHYEWRLVGVGRVVVDLLRERFPHRRLVAFSEGADGFWGSESVGWHRCFRAGDEMAIRSRPLYIAPRN